MFSTQPSSPVAMISAYMTSIAPPDCATLIERPSPAEPITNSAVTARISATEADRRRPVMT